MDERRYYGLDALRGGMMMLGIVLHAAIVYLAAPPPILAFFAEHVTSPVCDGLVHFIHSFRMPMFFLLSGFFTALLVDKRGVLGTYRNRAARVLAPLLVAAVTILPVTAVFLVDYVIAVRFGVHQLVPDSSKFAALRELLLSTGMPADEPGLAHLWFLYYLCYFYLLIPLCRWLSRRRPRADEAVDAFLASPASLVVLGLYTAATLWPFPAGQVYGEFLLIKPHVPALVYYGSFFVFGYVLHAHRRVLSAQTRFLPWTVPAALVLFPLSVWLSSIEHGAASSSLHLATVVAHGLCTWALVSALIGAVLKHFDHESPWTLYVSQASYWVFLVHMPAVMLFAWLLVPYALPALAKFALVVASTALVCLVSYHYAVQRTWVGRFLNGKRFDLDWPWRKPPIVHAPDGKAVR